MDHRRKTRRVRLLFRDGMVVEDVAKEGPVLFVVGQEARGAVQVELYDEGGELVRAYEERGVDF